MRWPRARILAMNGSDVSCGGPGSGRRMAVGSLQAAASRAWVAVRLAARCAVELAALWPPALRACAMVALGGLAAAQPAAPASRTAAASIAAARTAAARLP